MCYDTTWCNEYNSAETGFYYLQSRYYDPEVGRFINADDVGMIGTEHSILITNFYVYCRNNCVNATDELGYGAIESLINALSKAIDFISNLLTLIKNMFYKQMKNLENSIKLLTRKQSKYLAEIKKLNSQVDSLSKHLGWFVYALTFIGLVTAIATTNRSGPGVARALLDFGIDMIISVITKGCSWLFERLGRLVPAIGFFLGIIGGWLLEFALKKF